MYQNDYKVLEDKTFHNKTFVRLRAEGDLFP